MDELVIITPSRGRPRQLRELIDACDSTAEGAVRVLPCLDNDDPDLDEYRKILPSAPRLVGDRKTLSGWTNHAAQILADRSDPPAYLASLGDDHRPRTKGWDRRLIEVIEAMDGPGIAYGNDLLQGERVPTAWVVSVEIVRTLGWMMLPACEHLYVDNVVRDLGLAAGRIAYRPDVVIEHLHPAAGKAAWDESYQRSNSSHMYARDLNAYQEWKTFHLPGDAEKVRALR